VAQLQGAPEEDPRARALRQIIFYKAVCRGCDDLPKSPREATVHATLTGHKVVEQKTYTVEIPE